MEFRLLGPLDVVDRRGPIPLGGPKQRTVLVHLLLRPNRVVTSGRLIDELWGDEPPDAARSTLRTYASHLRKALGPDRLEGSAGGYVLHLEPSEVDALRFETLLEQARKLAVTDPADAAGVFGEALALWRGDALEDLSDQPSLLPEISRLEELRMSATEERIAAELASGRHAEVIPELETLCARHPLREGLWAHLMVALYRSGRQGNALDVFQRARTALAEELGVDPSPDLRRLQEQILRQDPSLEVEGRPLRGYRLLDQIGEGAFGAVFRAVQPQVGRDVAVKVVHPRLANQSEFIRRFETEAELVARLEHPHVVPLYDYWREPDGTYLVMRYLRGGNLREKLLRGPLDARTAAGVMDQVSLALAAAHRQGVVHRDVKPANVLFDEEGNAYLSDFGIARDLAAAIAGPIRGSTPSPFVYYTSPEEIRGEAITPRTDVYGLGLVLYETLAGGHPFADVSSDEVIEKHLFVPVPPLRDSRPGWPAEVDEVIGRATAKDPADRYPDAPSLASAFRAALGHAVAPPISISAVDARNPYKGLRPFLEGDVADFFGREELVERLVARMAEDAGGSRLLAVVGPSGSGKSSLVRAGLVPALRRGAVPGSADWFVAEMTPGGQPLAELDAALLRVALEPLPASVADQLGPDENGLVRAAAWVLPADDSELLLSIDQFEELFNLVEDEEQRARFLESLVAAVTDPASRIRVVLTLRADFFDRPLMYREFGDLLAARTEAITPLSAIELERAISGPAARAGVRVEPSLEAELVTEVAGQPGALPLFQYALTELFEHREKGVLTLDAYLSIGGVSGALARRAEKLYAALDDLGKDTARQLFLRLLTLGEDDGEITRRRILRSELVGLEVDRETMDRVIDAFGAHRLLTFDRDPVTRGPTVEVAHEALLREWPRLRGWIDSAREDVRAERRLAAAAGEWGRADRDPSFLLRGSRLSRFEAWESVSGLVLSPLERDFLEQSGAASKREVEQQRRTDRRLRGLLLGTSVFLVVALVTGVLALVQADRAGREANRAERQARISAARELAAAALANLEVDPERSVLLALEAVKTTYSVDGTVLRQAEEALHRAVQAQRVVLTIPELNSFDYSPDGSRLVAHLYHDVGGGTDAWILDADTGEKLVALRGHSEPVVDAEWGPDGTRLATVSEDGSVKLWDPEDGRELSTWNAHRGGTSWVEFSQDGQRLATTGPDGFARVWDVRSGRQVIALRANTDGVGAGGIAWSPDGTRLAAVPNLTCCFPSALKVWDVDSGRLLFASKFAPDDIPYGFDVAWSPDGDLIVTNGPTLRGWDAENGRRVFTLFPTADVANHELSLDGRLLAAGARDGTAEVWEMTAEGPRELLTLPSSGAAICCVTFSPDGTHLAVGSGGYGAGWGTGVGRVWDVSREGGREWLTVPAVAGEGVDVAYSPDGRLLAVSDVPWGVSLRDVATGDELLQIDTRATAWVTGIDFSPDGSRVATAGNLGVNVWDVATGEKLLGLTGHEDWVNSVIFSPDGTRLATASDDGTFRLWDAASGEELFTLERRDEGFVWAIALSPDGKLLATAGTQAGPLKLWDPATGREERTLAETGTGVRGLAFSPDGSRLAAALGDGTVRSWDPATGRELVAFQAHEGVATSVAFSPDGNHLASGGTDGLVKLWDATTGQELLALTGHEAEVWNVAFSPDGKLLAASGTDGTARVWVLRIEDLIELANNRVTRSLTDEECRRYLHVDRCL